jgi:hypothetical protein
VQGWEPASRLGVAKGDYEALAGGVAKRRKKSIVSVRHVGVLQESNVSGFKRAFTVNLCWVAKAHLYKWNTDKGNALQEALVSEGMIFFVLDVKVKVANYTGDNCADWYKITNHCPLPVLQCVGCLA